MVGYDLVLAAYVRLAELVLGDDSHPSHLFLDFHDSEVGVEDSLRGEMPGGVQLVDLVAVGFAGDQVLVVVVVEVGEVGVVGLGLEGEFVGEFVALREEELVGFLRFGGGGLLLFVFGDVGYHAAIELLHLQLGGPFVGLLFEVVLEFDEALDDGSVRFLKAVDF